MKRLWLRVDPSWSEKVRASTLAGSGQRELESAVACEVDALGWGEPSLVVQDPSDPRVFTALVTYERSNGPPDRLTPGFCYVCVEKIEEVDPETPSAIVDVRSLDAGTPQDLLKAVRFALLHEHDPMRLEGLAGTLEGDFPVLGSLVLNMARFERLARATNAKPDRVFGGPERITYVLDIASSGLRTRDVFRRYRGVASRVPRGVNIAAAPIPDGVAVSPEAFGDAVAALVRNPDLLAAPPFDAADMAARSAVERIDGFAVVNPARVRYYMPAGPTRVASSAIKAAHGSMRPTVGQISSIPTLAARLGTMRDEDGPAQASMDRARRLLDRWNWVEWIKRHEQAQSYG